MPSPTRKLARRAPLQARGVRRVDAILDAASSLLAEVGYEALTLTSVAERSESNIASLYRFFSNKDQLLDALADRIAARLRELAETVLDVSQATVSVNAFVDNLIDQLATVAIEYPGLGELMGRLEARHRSVDAQIAARLEAIFSARSAQTAPSDRGPFVRMTMTIVRAGIRLIATAPPKTRGAIIAELKIALTAYLEARLN